MQPSRTKKEKKIHLQKKHWDRRITTGARVKCRKRADKNIPKCFERRGIRNHITWPTTSLGAKHVITNSTRHWQEWLGVPWLSVVGIVTDELNRGTLCLGTLVLVFFLLLVYRFHCFLNSCFGFILFEFNAIRMIR